MATVVTEAETEVRALNDRAPALGALEVLGASDDKRVIWQQDEFPVRFNVKPLIMLNAEHGVDMQVLEGKVDFYAGPDDRPGGPDDLSASSGRRLR